MLRATLGTDAAPTPSLSPPVLPPSLPLYDLHCYPVTFFLKWAARLAFGPVAQAGPACLRAAPLLPRAAPVRRARARPHQSAHAAWPPCAGEHAARQPRPAPRPPVAPSPARPRRAPPHSSISLSHLRQRKQQPQHSPPPRAIAGVGCSGRSSAPETSPSCPEHRLLLAHLVLTSVSHGKLPFPGNLSSESWPSSPERSAPWTSPLRPPPRSPFTRTSTARTR
ncbi:early nodulin-like protein 1 [Miscanthus floridulus]|uniref:early nodulin-like protein 1 n=1 Tax=Miscanthus floridulus TaxID=154761 RepID=UPI00345805EB